MYAQNLTQNSSVILGLHFLSSVSSFFPLLTYFKNFFLLWSLFHLSILTSSSLSLASIAKEVFIPSGYMLVFRSRTSQNFKSLPGLYHSLVFQISTGSIDTLRGMPDESPTNKNPTDRSPMDESSKDKTPTRQKLT